MSRLITFIGSFENYFNWLISAIMLLSAIACAILIAFFQTKGLILTTIVATIASFSFCPLTKIDWWFKAISIFLLVVVT